MGRQARPFPIIFASALVLAASGVARAGDATAAPGCLAGVYDGGEMEMAAGLELGADGRFAYGLSYGALDEEAQGKWRSDGVHVFLTSDPVKAPAFSLVSETPARDGAFHIVLDLPEGMSAQYFDADVQLDDGSVLHDQMGEDGRTYDLDASKKPVGIRLYFPVFDLASDAFAVSGARSAEVRIRFEPNDLGKVGFSDAPLQRDGGDLLLQRFGGTLRFHPMRGGCAKDRHR